MPWRRYLAYALGGLAFVWAVAYVDLTLRAKHAYQEGEKYMAWDKDPAMKKAGLEKELEARLADLKSKAAKEKWPAEKLDQRIFLARFEHGERLKESSLKYAYVWFQSAHELFTPPESKWVVMSRARAAEAKALWKRELDAKKIPYQDYMLE